MKLICIGDSLTYGYCVPRRDTWVALTAVRTGIEIINEGVNGDTTGGMLARFSRDVTGRRPDAAFFMGGCNDMMTGCPNSIPQCNVMSMVHQALGNGMIPLIGVPVPCWTEGMREDWAAFADGNLNEERLNEYRSWLLRFGETFGVPVVDFAPPFLELQRRGEADAYYIDGIHPAKPGHALMAQTMCEALKRAGLWRPRG